MWLFTTRGFYSVVEKREDRADGMLTVRARSKADIDSLRELLPNYTPVRNKGTDYPWRVRVTAADWTHAMARLALEIDYSNFKDEVTRRQGKKRHDIYMRVWAAMLSLEPRRRSRRRRYEPVDDWQGTFPWGA
jgi:hypothetical protein